MSTLSHQPQPSSQPSLVTHVPTFSRGHESDHASPDSSFQPQIQPTLQAAPESDHPESTEELASDSGSKGFAAAPPSDPQDPSTTHTLLQAQRERDERFGHHFERVSVISSRPALQPKLSLSLGLIQAQGSQREDSADSQLESQLSQSKGGGSPLDSGTRQFMESRFDQDFSGVRVHTDASAVQMNQQIQAQAFTHGQDIFFGAGKFDTGSTQGKQLLAHELTHTVQQTGSKPLQAKPDREGPLVESGHVPGMMMAYGLQQEANWMQRAGEGFHNPGLVIQRSPDSVQVHQSTQGQEQISGGFLDWVLPKELVQAKEMLGTILKGASGLILSILKNPVGFLGNLITGLKSGFQNFLGNIGQYLQSGLVGWLTGALGSTGIEMPKDVFSLKGIFSLVMQVLGATWTQVRGRIVSAIPGGEQAMAALEEGTEIFQVVMKEGIGGLWDYVKDQFGDLQGQVMGQIKDMVVVQGIQQGIKFILSMLNPVSGLVRAAMAIYDVVKFFIERGSQVASLVEAVIGSIKSVANGAVEEAAKLVESALGRSIPVLIGFLSSVAGLGNLVSKVQGIFQKMRQPVDKAVNWLIKKAKDLVRQLGQRLGLVKNNESSSDRNPQENTSKTLEKGVHFTAENGEKHHLWVDLKGKDAVPMVASTNPSPVEQRLDGWQNRIGTLTSSSDQSKATNLITQAKPLTTKIDQTAEFLVREHNSSTASKLTAQQQRLAGILKQLFDLFGDPHDLTPAQKAKLEQSAIELANQIKSKGDKTKFLNNPMAYLDKTGIHGGPLETVGHDVVVDHAKKQIPGSTVWQNVHLRFYDSAGNTVGGSQAELDWLIFSPSPIQVQEVISAKIRSKQVKAKVDRRNLQHYYNLSLPPQAAELNSAFGKANYSGVTQIRVHYNDEVGAAHKLDLNSLRSSYPMSQAVINAVTIRGITAREDSGGPHNNHLDIGISGTDYKSILIDMIKKHL